MKKQADSLNSIGYTTISIDRDTKQRIKDLAGDKDIYEFVRTLVKSYAENDENNQIPLKTGIQSQSESIVSLNHKVSMLETAYTTWNEKADKVLRYLADREPEQVALFKILAYGEEKTWSYTPEMLKADISEAVTKVIEKITEKQVNQNGESQPV